MPSSFLLLWLDKGERGVGMVPGTDSGVSDRGDAAALEAGSADGGASGSDGGSISSRMRWAFRVVLLVILLGIGECGSRAFWLMRGVPVIGQGANLHLSFYPEIGAARRATAEAPEGSFHVLLLGGSVLNNDYGDIEHVLRERLSRRLGRHVVVMNLAQPAHTSLDSAIKYSHLSDVSFDLVLFYHGINELRANNCSAELYRDDYGHFAWYRLIRAAERGRERRFLMLPYTLRFVTSKVMDRLSVSAGIPLHEPAEETLPFGCDVKTAGAFRANVERVARLAEEKGEALVLMTFASFVPDDYSREKFDADELAYTSHAFPIELWGSAECVGKGLAVHNEVIRSGTGERGEVLFVDQARAFPPDGVLFNDVCHFTHEGCERFVENLLAELPATVLK